MYENIQEINDDRGVVVGSFYRASGLFYQFIGYIIKILGSNIFADFLKLGTRLSVCNILDQFDDN